MPGAGRCYRGRSDVAIKPGDNTLERDRLRLTRPIRAASLVAWPGGRACRRRGQSPIIIFASGDSGAAESTVQDTGWNGGQPVWQLRILLICANASSPLSPPA